GEQLPAPLAGPLLRSRQHHLALVEVLDVLVVAHRHAGRSAGAEQQQILELELPAAKLGEIIGDVAARQDRDTRVVVEAANVARPETDAAKALAIERDVGG